MKPRLAWHGHRGVAQRLGRTVQLRAAPVIGGQAVDYLDFDPENGVREIRPRVVDERRDLLIDEEAECNAWLRAFVPSQAGNL